MILIIGLGNPGKKYQFTRHNAGFLALENFQQNSHHNFSAWQENKKFQALISESSNKKIKLILPQTFMNNSGVAVATIAKFFKVPSPNIWVVHDDLDLPLGKIKIQIDHSAAGHNGIKSIIEKTGSQNFGRFRIGIKPAIATSLPGSELVLKNFTATEKRLLKEVFAQTIAALEEALAKNLNSAMNKFNT
ncbi:MAG TPA: aminoacyl-tRNA hydrolase [Candidatus Magasanikbacteria bacterium]|nr:aminoacyl-tRNA hydrolase [Candidatus Magasanikbacteria bacterium]